MSYQPSYRISQTEIAICNEYGHNAANYTSRRHDAHHGGAGTAGEYMAWGKRGERIFAHFLEDHGIPYTADDTPYDTRDEYDFLVGSRTVNVKTTKYMNGDLIEFIENYENNSLADIYVSVYMPIDSHTGTLTGWCYGQDFTSYGYNHDYGYGTRRVVPSANQRDIADLLDIL